MNRASIPRRRWGIGLLLGVGVLVNYFDRIGISVVAPQMQHELHLDALQLGVLFSAFSWSYAIFQVPSGMLIDRFGVTRLGRASIFLWGCTSLMTAMAGGYGGIFVARVLLGAAEAPSFPLCSKATGYWFPRKERGRATSLFDGTTKLANALGVPMIAVATVAFGWRGAFVLSAALSFLFFVAYWLLYRDPSQDKKLSPAERNYIVEGGAAPEGEAAGVGSMAMLAHVLGYRRVWAILLGFASFGYLKSLFESWLPTYLVQTMGLSILKSASFTSIPWIAGTVVQFIVGGWLADHLVARGHDETWVRKTCIVGSVIVSLAIFCVPYCTTPFWALVALSVSMSGLSTMATIAWSLPSLIAPRNGAGVVGGLMNFMGGITGSVQAIITGYIVMTTGSFGGAFIAAGIVMSIALLSYGILLDQVEPVPDASTEPRGAEGLAGRQA